MSLKLMVRVMETIEVPRPHQAVLLAMAENAADDGSRCFPSVDLIAWKAGYRSRNVVDIIRALRKAGVLEIVAPATGNRPTEYQIHLDRAPAKAPFDQWQAINGRHAQQRREAGDQEENAEESTREIAPVQSHEGCNPTSPGVHSHVQGVQSHAKTTRENAPRTVSEPSGEPSENHLAASDDAAGEGPDGKPSPRDTAAGFAEWWVAYPSRLTDAGKPTKGSRSRALDKWRLLTEGQQAAAMAGLPGYIAERGDKPVDAERYLSRRLWRDYVDDVPVIAVAQDSGPLAELDREIERVRTSRDVEYLGSAGSRRRSEDLARLLAERDALLDESPADGSTDRLDGAA